MEIKPSIQVINNDVGTRTNSDRTQTGKAPPSGSPPIGNTDDLTLTDTARNLIGLQDQLSATTEVDMEKVEAIRAAIADGSYEVDQEQLANNLIQSSLELP